MLLISGAARGTRTTLPALLIHGHIDRMTPLGPARAFTRASPRATLELFDGGHFILLHREAEVRTRISAWLTELVSSN
jgi:pimeloyl-ACP methyl ester carboxylesterase